MKRKLCSLLLALLLAISGGAAATGEEYVRVSLSELQRLTRLEKLNAILKNLEAYALDTPDIEKLIDGAAAGMLYALEDDYAYYVPAEDAQAEMESISGQYVGVGTQIMIDAKTLRPIITRVFEGTGAQEAGLQKGDLVIAVDGVVPPSNDLDAAATAMRGEANTQVRMTIQRGDQLMELDVTRRASYSNSVEYRMLEGNIGYIILYEFINESAREFAAALEALSAQGMQGLLLDLRDNGGGEVDNCLAIADMLLPEGTIILRRNTTEGEVVETSDAKLLGLPMVVLVNEASASASEILSGAIKHYGVGTLVGTKTYGKGVIQYLLTLSDGSMMNFTCEEYLLPDGSSIHKIGIEPDIEQRLEGEYSVTYRRIFELPEAEDSQLQRGLSVLREKMASADAPQEGGVLGSALRRITP